METQSKTSAKDVFINLGAIVALYTLVVSLVNLLFTVINSAYPKITNAYQYMGSASISWPVATLIIFFPIFILLMWLLEKDFKANPEKQLSGIHKWLSYLTLFISGVTIAVDLITVLYYFIDGQEISTAFLLKVLVLLVIATGLFSYYLYDVRGKLTGELRKIYRIVATVIVVGSIIWGFAVLGSPRTQRLYNYDEQKVSDLSNIQNGIENFYSTKGKLPVNLDEVQNTSYYFVLNDAETNKPYEYKKTGDLSYELCAVFNKDSKDGNSTSPQFSYYGGMSWEHVAGEHCFKRDINPNLYTEPAKPLMPVKY
jgi:Domain of unknown function (DUF5671)